MANLLPLLKLFAYSVLGVLAAALLLCFSPFLLAYFLFDRLCTTIEEFRPANKKKRRGDRLKQAQKFLALLPSNRVKNLNPKGG